MAQDFYAAFKVGEDDRHITSIDEDGVALAAIKALAVQNQGLHAENRELYQENHGLHAENRDLRELLAKDVARLAHDEAHLTRDDYRFLALERKVGSLAGR
jgi:regulator of replication initiation timing